MKYKIALTLYIFILGLIPLLWFKDGQVITGTDVNFPPFPIERLVERSYTWSSTLFAGAERAVDVSSLPYTSIPGLLNLFIKNIVTVEKISYVIMFTLTGFSMAYLLEKLFVEKSEKEKFLIKIFGVLFYMINFYNVFLWVRLQLTVTTLVFVPILFGVLHLVLERNTLKAKDLLFLAVVTIYAGPLGKQPPIIYVVLMAMLVYIGFYLSFDIFGGTKKVISKLKKLFYVSIVVIACSAYWIFPLGNYIFRSGLIGGAESGKEIYNVEELLSWTSKVSTNLNVFRSFGDVVWFEGWGDPPPEPYFPEFLEFYSNQMYMILSFVFALIIFSAFYFNRKSKKIILVFGLITLTSLFFSRGTHPPFENIFKWFFNNLPGFWIHRAPWQKFGLITTLGYAVLGSYGAYSAVNYFYKKFKISKIVTTLLLVGAYLLLNNIFITGKMFSSKEGDVGYHEFFDLGFHHSFPDYLGDARDYIQKLTPNENYNVLLLPEQHTSVYKWGYAGATDIVSSFLKQSTVKAQFGEGYALDGYISNIYNAAVLALYSGNVQGLDKVFDLYNINYILQRNDFRYDFYGDFDSPKFIQRKLSTLNLLPPQKFGEWDLYETIRPESYPLIYPASNFIDITGVENNILLPVTLNSKPNTVLLEGAGDLVQFSERYMASSGKFLEKVESLDEQKIEIFEPEVNVNPDSLLYFLIKVKEKVLLRDADDAFWFASKRIMEIVNYPDLSIDKKNKLFAEYLDLIEEYVQSVSKEPDQRELAKQNLKASKNISWALERVEEINLSGDTTSNLNETLEGLLKQVEDYENSICVGYCYDFDITKSGQHELIFIEPNYTYLSSSNYTIEVKNNDLKPEKFGNIYNLEDGKLVISLDGPRDDLIPLIQNTKESFDTFVNEIGEKEAASIPNKIELGDMYRFVFDVRDFKALHTLKFLYESNGGIGVIILEENEGEKGVRFIGKDYNDRISNLVNTYEREVKTTNGVRNLIVYVLTYASAQEERPHFRMGNLNLTRSFNPNIVLKSTTSLEPAGKLPEITFERLNPTKYIVRLNGNLIENEFALVMNQTYNPFWRVYRGEGTRENNFLSGYETYGLKQIAKDSHFKSNFFSNAWYLTPRDLQNTDYLIIEFVPQRVFYTAAIFSVATPIILGISVIKIRRKNEN